MQGNVSPYELGYSLSLEPELKEKISDYEKKSWAADIDSDWLQTSWRDFLRHLEKAVENDDLDDKDLISLISYLSTKDTVNLLHVIGGLNEDRQSRFIELLNWVADKSVSSEQKQAAIQVKERILMTYRMAKYPIVYSQSRISRAIKIMSA
jgi:hypothetical protein